MIRIEDLYEIYIHSCEGTIDTDTRNISPGSLFFCLQGSNFDGNLFAKEALKKKAAFAVIDNPDYQLNDRTILVENTLATLQNLASYHRKKTSVPVIGITGTNGKTTTKELLAAVLKKKYRVLYTEGNLNNHIGVPLTILKIRSDHEIAIIEMGANHSGEIEQLCNIADPNMGIITNVGKGHLEGFRSVENIFITKTALYRHFKKNHGVVFVLFENKQLKEELDKLQVKTIYYSKENRDAACFGELINEKNKGDTLIFNLSVRDKTLCVQTRLFGSFNLDNALAASCAGNYLSVSPHQIKDALEEYTPGNNRSEIRKTKKNTLILDLYNANPTSMKAAINDFFSSLNQSKRACILGDMLELGDTAEKEHLEILHLIKNHPDTLACFVGKNFAQHTKDFPAYHFFNSSEELLVFLQESNLQGFRVLLKGSRGIHLENAIRAL
jgi:UDP-N-acetylmuramoyl-tripeptide--D-alanyl-D-alanine ligase